ncbi:MAG: DUF2752 domain-containing protein [Armatimonadetes bacterium]|nr:DUF2752 domain-containing protein [Armatimonadota bacterium]
MEEMAEGLVIEARVKARRGHMQWLVLCAAVIVASALLEVQPRGITVPGAPGRPLPGLCVSRTVFHMNCPTCGMTRSFAAMAHGRLRLAFALHRLGPLGFLLVLLQVPLRAYAVFTGVLPRAVRNPRLATRIIVALVIALVGNWIVNLVTGAAFRTG